MKLSEVIAELRTLNEPAPKPARLPTETEVAAVEKRLGIRFQTDYRYFLLHGSDIIYGAVEPAMVTPDAGHLDLVELATEAWEVGVPAELLPFCESDGDYYCLKTNGRVLYWSDEGSINESWPNLATWIQQVWMEEQEEQDEDEEPEEDDDE